MDPISMDTATSSAKTRISWPLPPAPPQRATHSDIRVAAAGRRAAAGASASRWPTGLRA